MDAEQFYAASLEVQRAQLAAFERLQTAVEDLTAALHQPITPVYTAPAQLELAATHSNGHAPAAARTEPVAFRSRRDTFGQELPRGISWDARGNVWQVDATMPGRARRRVRVPLARFEGIGHDNPHARGLAEACHVRSVLLGIDTKQHLAALHPDTARDVAEAMAR